MRQLNMEHMATGDGCAVTIILTIPRGGKLAPRAETEIKTDPDVVHICIRAQVDTTDNIQTRHTTHNDDTLQS